VTKGSSVILLPDARHGMGTIVGFDKHGWPWVEWADGHFDKYPPHSLELADVWEHRQADSLTPDSFRSAA
jgi:hypothetical protein